MASVREEETPEQTAQRKQSDYRKLDWEKKFLNREHRGGS